MRWIENAFAAGALFCFACHGETPAASAKPVEATASATVSSSAPAASSAAPSSSAVSAPRDVRQAAIEVANRWNAALNTGDTAALAKLYAPNLSYYGAQLGRDAAIKRVSDALAKKPYHQDIASVNAWKAKTGIRVQFKKKFGSQTVDGYLIVDEATLLILEESDMQTNDALVLAGPCVPFGQKVTVTGTLGEAVGPNEDWWALALDKPMCVSEAGGAHRIVVEIPETNGRPSVPAPVGKRFSLSGFFVPEARHQICTFVIESLHPLP